MLLFALLWACSDTIINEVKQPEIIVAPATLEFGHLRSGYESKTRTVTIANAGSKDLIIDHLEIDGENYAVDAAGFTVSAGGYHQIHISYTPQTFEHNEGYLDIYLEGDEVASEGVWLDGNGDAPVITVTPAELDYGSPLLGCDTTQEIIIQNNGNIDLVVNDISIMSNIPADITIDFGTLPAFPWTIAPAGRIAFYSNYTPLDELDDLTTYDISSNDPAIAMFAAYAAGAAVISNEQIQNWIQQTTTLVDIVWIIDNSGSMHAYQTLLGQNMQSFMNIFLTYSPDFQIAFITTDSSNFVGGAVNNASVDPIAESVAAINSIGIGGSGWEKGLQMFETCVSSGDCNSWMRPDASLIAIFLSDEPDNSNVSPIDVISTIDTIKPGMFTPYGIIGDVPSGCTQYPLIAQAGLGYYDIINHYSSQWWSICDNDWGTQLEELAQNISIKTVFSLDSEDPHVDTIQVWINGQLIEDGWIYDEDLNSVVFNYDDAPQPGDSVDVGYSSWACGGR